MGNGFFTIVRLNIVKVGKRLLTVRRETSRRSEGRL